jgi:hypothetical protein
VNTRDLAAELSRALGRPEAEVLGWPVAVALRWRAAATGVFLSGVPADVVTRVCRAFGASVATDRECGTTTFSVADEWWSDGGGRGIGTGPVVVARGNGTPVGITAPVYDGPVEPTKLEHAQALRARFECAAAELDAGLAQPPDPGALLAALDSEPAVAAAVVDGVADSRLLVGRYLLDTADELDDERIDQLGDGYVRAAHLWAALPQRPDPELVDEVLALERACAGWMHGAASPPTRYAF